MTLILTIVLLFGSVILAHEFGHFIMARMTGMRVEKFSIGFPPRLLSLKPTENGWVLRIFFFKSTESGLKWQPILKFNLSRKFAKSKTEYNFALIPLGGYVKVAGVIDESFDKKIVGAKDEFSGKNGFQKSLFLLGGVLMNFVLAFVIFSGIFYHNGIPSDSTRIDVATDGPSEIAGIQSGDSLLTISGEIVETWDDLVDVVRGKPDQNLTIEYFRSNRVFSTTVHSDSYELAGADTVIVIGRIGVIREMLPIGFYQSAILGAKAINETLGLVVYFVRGLFSGEFNFRKHIGGPITIVNEAHSALQSGWIKFFYFIAFISVQIGIFNLFPIPGLDGGHLLIVIIESLIRKPLSLDTRIRIQQVGLTLLFALMIYVVFNDIVRLF